MTRKLMMKAGAVASLVIGAGLMALPALAGSQECVTDGGYHPPVASGMCVTRITSNPPSAECADLGQCSAKQVPKGWYCAGGGAYTTCQTLPPREEYIQRYPEPRCKVSFESVPAEGDQPAYIKVTCGCDVGDEPPYPSSETALVGDCKTVYGAVG